MSETLRLRFWWEAAAATILAAALALTLIEREWIEALFGVEPDAGSGAFEWLIVVGLAAATVGTSRLARREWRRAAPAGA